MQQPFPSHAEKGRVAAALGFGVCWRGLAARYGGGHGEISDNIFSSP